MSERGVGTWRLQAFHWVLGAGFLVLLAANLPGHMSYDSAAQLREGYLHVRETWGPPIYAWILGAFDSVIPGTALYVVASALLLFVSLALVARLRGRIGWLGLLAAVFVVLTPQVLIYQAIVWKDVLFANCAIAGLVLLANAAQSWETRARWGWLAGSVALLALALLVRQNGAIAPLMGALAAGWIAARGRFWRGVGWGAGFVAAVAVAAQLLTLMTALPNRIGEHTVATGIRIVQGYDISGAVTLDRSYRLGEIAAFDPRTAEVVQARAPLGYSPQRVDFLDEDKAFGAALTSIPSDVIAKQWRDLVLRHPALYLRVRLEDFRWVLLTPDIDRCLPIWTGIDAPANMLAPVGLKTRSTRADFELANYHTWYLDTPAYSHITYALLSLALAGVLLWRREPADVAMAALQLSAAAFAASFLLISIACDYRYLYFTDLAALVGLVYVAADVPGLRRRA
jgi:hypothetical protein